MPKIVVSGSRRDAYEDFVRRHSNPVDKNEHALIVVDAEGPVSEVGSWRHLKDRDGWNRPSGTTNHQCHLMVQVTESWFLADRKSLSEYYGQGFQESALPSNPQIEEISKGDILDGMRRATRSTKKGRYNKGSHSFEILEKIDPKRVTDASRHARQFVETLFQLTGR